MESMTNSSEIQPYRSSMMTALSVMDVHEDYNKGAIIFAMDCKVRINDSLYPIEFGP
jgi:hypothetical protein